MIVRLQSREAFLRMMFERTGRVLSLVLLLVVALPGTALAAGDASGAGGSGAGEWSENDQGKLRLLSASENAGTGETLRLGLHFEMDDTWKIYWRSPGDAGYPPDIDWKGSENLESADLRWPVPERFELFGMQTFGYGGTIVLPIDARPKDPSEPVKLRANVDYLTCREICIPHRVDLALDIPPGDGGASEHAFLIDRFRAMVPGEGDGAGMDLQNAVLTAGGEAPELRVSVASDIAFDSPDAIIEHAEGFRFGKPDVRLEQQGQHAVLTLTGKPEFGDPVELAGQTVTLTVFDGPRGLEREIRLTRAEPATGLATLLPGWLGGSGGGTTLGTAEFAGILALAVLGGLILNLMPCVLPVLSIKLLSVVSQGGKSRGHIRASFLASAAGILVSFMVLAAGAIALKATGSAVGWGMQFQQPLFLVALTLILTLFAANLFGFFEVPLPRFLADAASGGDRGGMPGHFMTGAFATLLATPCSAPFLGTAIAFALSRGALEIVAIFLALGVGLALPYLAVAAVPAIAGMMPRPGAWMITLRKILGLALAATGLWLMSVLAAQEGLLAAGLVTGLMVLLGLLLWARGHLGTGLRRAVPGAVAAVAALAFVMPATVSSPPSQAAQSENVEMDGWQRLDEARIREHVNDGKVVFVDVTADWCITCQVNKARVLDSAAVQEELHQDGVVRMRGDWTRPSDDISAYLASFGRYGIPFNAVYGPEQPDGLTLPELLSNSSVLDAMEKARNGEAG